MPDPPVPAASLAPPFDVAHKMQRLALDLAWRTYGHHTEARERLATWLREHGLEVWRLVHQQQADALAAQRVALAKAERDYLRMWEDRDECISKAKRTDAAEAELEAQREALAHLREQQLTIAGLVNSYHNDGTRLTAAETLREIANALGAALSAAPDGER